MRGDESLEKTLVSITAYCVDLAEQTEVLRRLVVSMALHIPREHLPDDERALLDELLERVS